MIELILGGARSGKSRLAEQKARHYQQKVVYIATAQALDDEMVTRIAHHQSDRPSHWQTVEEPIYLADKILQFNQDNPVILVDCLTLWLTNLLLQDDECIFRNQVEQFFQSLEKLHSETKLILVSNETGLGVVPMGEISRKFVDESGWLHQRLASRADMVTFCVAGLPMILKSID